MRLAGLRFMLMLMAVLRLAAAQDSSRPWERLGLSLTEWKLIQDNHLQIEKVESLLRDGIGITEYLGKPWEQLGISEEKWIALRRSGMTSYDIELETKTPRGQWRKEVGEGLRSDLGGVSENGAMITSLVLPGYQQIRMNHAWRGYTMATCAVGAAAWCVAGSLSKGRFEYVPIGAILIPDMIWSMLDYKRSAAVARH